MCWNESDMHIVRRLSQSNYMFVETDSGLFEMEDYLTLMLFEKSFLVSVSKRQNQDISVHEVFKSRSSARYNGSPSRARSNARRAFFRIL